MSTTFKEIQSNYKTNRETIKKIEDRINQRHLQISRLERKRDRNRIWWGYGMVKPIIELVRGKFPELTWDDEYLVALGLRCAVSVFGCGKDGKAIVGLTFTPTDLENGIISFDNGINNGDAGHSNSIYSLNGFQYKQESLIDIEQLYTYIEEKINNN